MVSWYSQNMAGQKLLRSSKICVESAGLTIAGGKENFGNRYKQNLKYLLVLSIDWNSGYEVLVHDGGQECTAMARRS
jgi:hypothetical protein